MVDQWTMQKKRSRSGPESVQYERFGLWRIPIIIELSMHNPRLAPQHPHASAAFHYYAQLTISGTGITSHNPCSPETLGLQYCIQQVKDFIPRRTGIACC